MGRARTQWRVPRILRPAIRNRGRYNLKGVDNNKTAVLVENQGRVETSLITPSVAGALARTDVAEVRYREARIVHWDNVARRMDSHKGLGRSYHRRLAEIFGFLVPKGSRVLELGCAQGDLLAGLGTSVGGGIYFSARNVEPAGRENPNLQVFEDDGPR